MMRTIREVYKRVYALPECSKKGGYFSISLPVVKEKGGKIFILFAVHQQAEDIFSGFVVYSIAEDHAVYLTNKQVDEQYSIPLIKTLQAPLTDETPGVDDPEFIALDAFEKAVLSTGFNPTAYVDYLKKVMAAATPNDRAVYGLFL